jgi:hypothetical protein
VATFQDSGLFTEYAMVYHQSPVIVAVAGIASTNAPIGTAAVSPSSWAAAASLSSSSSSLSLSLLLHYGYRITVVFSVIANIAALAAIDTVVPSDSV